jgi:molybdopterin synthase catalytic subunit
LFAIAGEPIDVPALEGAVGAASGRYGGVVTFLGRVRDRTAGARAVNGLTYEAFEPMAVAEFERIAEEARERFGDVRLAIVHRIGELAPGEVSVAIVAAAAHRKAAFAACEYAIDEVKRRAAIWKRERYADGSGRWADNAS